ncbi:MAG: hypothetical protein Hals2KO_35270 [Halioglobus sp.]
MNLRTISALLVVLFSSVAQALDESDYLEFFEKYQTLSDNFDTAVVELYSDTAEIKSVRKMSDGIEQAMKIEGKKWKQMIIDTMDLAKQRGDKSEFSKIKVLVQNNRARITANRYSTIKCFNDIRYYMVIEKVNSKEFKIVEEFMESPLQSACADTTENDLSLVLQGSVEMLNRQLPTMVDSDTKLERASSEGNTLIYHFVFVNYLSSELDAVALEQNLRPMVTQQTCTVPNFKPVIDQGGSVSYRYNGKDQKQILAIVIDKSSCS